MKAVEYSKTGPPEVLQIVDVERPTPGDDEILVRVHATTVTAGDVNLRSFKHPTLFWLSMRVLYGRKRPRRAIPGTEFAGDIEAAGKNVTLFRTGDPVFGSTGLSFGANAEYVCLPDSGVVARMPAGLSYQEAAAIPVGALTALFFLRKGNIQSGQRVLVNGASGGVGVFAIQLARHFGAEVAGLCSANNLKLVKSLGAGQAIDYTSEDFTRGAARYDLIFDAVGKTSRADCKNVLAPDGSFVTVKAGLAQDSAADLRFLRELFETGELGPVIDRRYPLDQIVEAHRYVEAGHKKGSVVITMEHSSE